MTLKQHLYAELELKTPGEMLDEIMRLRGILEWYAEQAAGCRKLGSIGDPFRTALNNDGGKRARAALSSPQVTETEQS